MSVDIVFDKGHVQFLEHLFLFIYFLNEKCVPSNQTEEKSGKIDRLTGQQEIC